MSVLGGEKRGMKLRSCALNKGVSCDLGTFRCLESDFDDSLGVLA